MTSRVKAPRKHRVGLKLWQLPTTSVLAAEALVTMALFNPQNTIPTHRRKACTAPCRLALGGAGDAGHDGAGGGAARGRLHGVHLLMVPA